MHMLFFVSRFLLYSPPHPIPKPLHLPFFFFFFPCFLSFFARPRNGWGRRGWLRMGQSRQRSKGEEAVVDGFPEREGTARLSWRPRLFLPLLTSEGSTGASAVPLRIRIFSSHRQGCSSLSLSSPYSPPRTSHDEDRRHSLRVLAARAARSMISATGLASIYLPILHRMLLRMLPLLSSALLSSLPFFGACPSWREPLTMLSRLAPALVRRGGGLKRHGRSRLSRVEDALWPTMRRHKPNTTLGDRPKEPDQASF